MYILLGLKILIWLSKPENLLADVKKLLMEMLRKVYCNCFSFYENNAADTGKNYRI